MKKIACITGTRPQLVKHAVLWKELQKHFHVTSLYTGQHYQYELNALLKKELFGAHLFHELALERTATPAERLGEMIQKISRFLETLKPDAVLVYGDTDTTLAGALAANKQNIKLIHVEAGERSFNRAMPEEHNRVVTDSLSDLLFCASGSALEHLKQEQRSGDIIYSGDLMKDLLLETAQLFQEPIANPPYFFCTIHRNYTKHDAAKITELLQSLSKTNCTVIFPVHPATAVTVDAVKNMATAFENIRFLPPVSYSDSIRYQKFAAAVITDSGGIQKEAYWLKRRCITVRKETEWTETLIGNWNQLVYEDLAAIMPLLHMPLGEHDPELYGTGNAAYCITKNLIQLI